MTDIYETFLSRYGSLTAVQKVALPIVERGQNCIIVAPTGAGKTEAAVLPIIKRLSGRGGLEGIKVLYITPLRALNRDMIKRLTWLCDSASISISVRHGDTLQAERRRQEKKAPVVLITTPETLQSILPAKSFAQHLKNIEFVVVDELHELYYNKRGAQLSVALERLEEMAPGFMRIGISATVSDPNVAGLFLCGGRQFKVASSGAIKKTAVGVSLPAGYGKHVKELSSKFDLDEKSLARIEEISKSIEASKSTLIFGNTRQVVEALGSRLVALNRIHDFGGIGVHHGSLDRNDRIEMEDNFKGGKIRSLIATSSLELGIDIGNIDLVIQYGSPRQALRLVQRVGRSGHSESGTATGKIIATSNMDAMEAISVYKNMKSGNVERFGVCEAPLDVLFNQVCGIALDKKSTTLKEIASLVRRSYPFRNLGDEAIRKMLEFMETQRMLFFDGEKVAPHGRTRIYYYGHLSVIPDTRKFVVKNISDNRVISALDEKFVAANIEEGSVFIVKGLPWKVVSIDEDRVSVEPSERLDAAIPDWSGEDIPVCCDVSKEAMRLMGSIGEIKDLGCTDKGTLGQITDFCEAQQKFGTQNSNALVVERVEDFLIAHTGLGTMANDALSRLLVHLMTTFIGRSSSVRSSPYFIMFDAPKNVRIGDLIAKINVRSIDRALEEAVKDTDLFRYKFVNVAKLFGVIDKGASLSKSLVKRIIRVMAGTPVYDEALHDVLRGFDLENLKVFLEKVQNGKTRIVESQEQGISPLADEILNAAYYTRELMAPSAPSKAILESFSSFLLKKDIELLCTYCGFMFTRKLSEIKEVNPLKCDSCGSVMICRYSELHSQVVKKRKDGKRLDKEGKIIFAEVMKEAGLFSSYGGKAALALATYGIGPSSAARALLMHRKEESLFYKDLIEAQKQFIRTKKYWSAG